MQYANELWVTAKQFEDDLKKQNRYAEIKVENMEIKMNRRIQYIKDKTAMYIHSIEVRVLKISIYIVSSQ